MFLSLEDYMLPCLNKKIFGLDCLGCGMQRAVLLLIRGDLLGAFKMYPAIFSLILLIVYVFLNFKFHFQNSQFIIRLLLVINTVLIVGNFVLKLL